MSALLLLLIFLGFYLANFRFLFLFSFILGLISDFYFGNLIGSTSLIFLAFVFCIFLYRRKFSSRHFIFQLFFVVLSDFVYAFVAGKIWHYQNIFVLFFLTLITYLIALRIKPRTSGLELEI